jgi:hypothetical protein
MRVPAGVSCEEIPVGYREATWHEYHLGLATHAVCRHGRLVAIDADDHCCRWTILVKEKDNAASD